MLASADLDPRKAGTIWAIHLGDELPRVMPEGEARFSLLGEADIPALSEAMGALNLPAIHARFAKGRQCYAAWMDAKIVSYGWVSFDEEIVGELDLRLRLIQGEAYIWDCATLPAYRNRHLYSALLSHILAELSASGKVCRVWIGADLDNTASQRGIANAGFRHVADLVIERFLALRMVWAQAAPGIPDSWLAEAKRVYLGNRDNIWLEALEQSRKYQGPGSF